MAQALGLEPEDLTDAEDPFANTVKIGGIGLTVAELRTLRRSLAGNAEYTVVKNTLAAIAARRAGLEDLAEDFTGPSALAFVTGEPVEAAKALRDFAKDNANLVPKGGMMDGNVLDAAAVECISALLMRRDGRTRS